MVLHDVLVALAVLLLVLVVLGWRRGRRLQALLLPVADQVRFAKGIEPALESRLTGFDGESALTNKLW